MTNGKGVDAVIEVGGAKTLDESIRAVKMGGHISMIGLLSGARGEVSTGRLIAQNIHLSGMIVGSRADFRSMISAIEATGIRPIISRHFPLEDTIEAFRFQQTGDYFGKVILDV